MKLLWTSLAVAVAVLAQLGCGTRDEVGQPVIVEPPADPPPPIDEPDPGAQPGEPTAPPDEPGPGAEPGEPAAGGGDNLVVGNDPCTTDADCVPADCCHAAACVAQANAPSCGDAMCTQECRFGTIDCGGGCLCHEGRCAARLSEPPPGLPQPGTP